MLITATNMAILLAYEKVQELRALMLEELLDDKSVLALTVEHMRLVEARIQTLLLCGATDGEKVKKAIKDKRNASHL